MATTETKGESKTETKEEAKTETKEEDDPEKKKLREEFNKKKFTKEEVSKHDDEDKPWIIIHGAVYDMTEFMLDHPGGPDVIQDIAGEDSTEEFENILHTANARRAGHPFLVGSMADADFDEWYENMSGKKKANHSGGGGDESSNIMMYVVVVILAVLAAAYFYNQDENEIPSSTK